ncbi:32743_t:CDS:2 [Gigaspora margarita]|uniref:32743_t:CDS:1 n=1 Tax=Gigaspora margarita TaxID=4874 RepID=A0ABN7VXQ5_GIGMA|nr:32743_t:CDS:2 [Gigaspora margarita]
MTIIAFISQKGGPIATINKPAAINEAKLEKKLIVNQATLEIAKKADLLIQPTGASRLDLVPAVKEFHALTQAGINKKKLLFILSRISTPAEAAVSQEFLKKSGYNYSPDYLMEKASYRQAQNEGKSITEISYKNLRKQAKEIINSILKHL